mgnify:CR=1 FL=1
MKSTGWEALTTFRIPKGNGPAYADFATVLSQQEAVKKNLYQKALLQCWGYQENLNHYRIPSTNSLPKTVLGIVSLIFRALKQSPLTFP